MKNYVNTVFTIRDLKASASEESLAKYDAFVEALKVLVSETPEFVGNGRVNHYWFQSVLAILSNRELKAGGQGNSAPDMFYGDNRVELKGFTSKELDSLYPIRVAASKYFASNGGITALKNSNKTLSEMKQIIFGDSYKDEYYMLTETCGLKTIDELEDVRIVFVESSVLKSCLIDDCGPHTSKTHHKWTINGKNHKTKINWPYIYVDTSKLMSLIGGTGEQ